MNSSELVYVDGWETALYVLDLFVLYFWAYFIIGLQICGIFGNSLAVIIFVRRRRHDRASSAYLGCMAICDVIISCFGINMWYYVFLPVVTGDLNPSRGTASTDLGCKFTVSYLPRLINLRHSNSLKSQRAGLYLGDDAVLISVTIDTILQTMLAH